LDCNPDQAHAMIYLADVSIHRMSSGLAAMSPASTAPCLRSGIKQEEKGQ